MFYLSRLEGAARPGPHTPARLVSAVRSSLRARSVILRNAILRGLGGALVVAIAVSGMRTAGKGNDRGCESDHDVRLHFASPPVGARSVCSALPPDPCRQDERQRPKDSQK